MYSSDFQLNQLNDTFVQPPLGHALGTAVNEVLVSSSGLMALTVSSSDGTGAKQKEMIFVKDYTCP